MTPLHVLLGMKHEQKNSQPSSPVFVSVHGSSSFVVPLLAFFLLTSLAAASS